MSYIKRILSYFFEINQFLHLRLIGGRGESHASVAEGLATALSCFDELAAMRGSGNTSDNGSSGDGASSPSNGSNGSASPNRPHRHALLVASSPPYAMPAQECHPYAGNTAEQLASKLNEVIFLSLLSNSIFVIQYEALEQALFRVTLLQLQSTCSSSTLCSAALTLNAFEVGAADHYKFLCSCSVLLLCALTPCSCSCSAPKP